MKDTFFTPGSLASKIRDAFDVLGWNASNRDVAAYIGIVETHEGAKVVQKLMPSGHISNVRWLYRKRCEKKGRPKGQPSQPSVWHYSEAGGTIHLEASDPLPRVLWERLVKYASLLEPPDPTPTPEGE